MKKVILLLFSMFFIFLFSSNIESREISVFNESDYIDNYDHDYFYVSSSNIILNTNNLEKYFSDSDIKIIGVYPNLDKIYNKDLKKSLSYYSFDSFYNNRVNINNFTNNYVGMLKNNNYIDMANMVYFDGISIDKVLIYSSYNSIYLHDLNYGIFNYKIKEF